MEKGRIKDRSLGRARGRWLATVGFRCLLSIIFAGIIIVSPAATHAETDARADRNFERFRVIAERSMFGRHRAGEETAESPPEDPGVTIGANIKLIGIVKMSNPLSSIAVIEEDGRHKLCHVGDQVGTLILRSIRDHDIVFESPGGHWLAEIEPGTTLHRGAVPGFVPPAGGFVQTPDPPAFGYRRRLPVRAVDIKRLANAGLVTHTENGVVKGLRLTRDALGLREGDRVTCVDGQDLCTRRPKQKLWQIVHKHSASRDRAAEIHVVVQRNNQTLEFLVAPVG
jgi:hypothetical protein